MSRHARREGSRPEARRAPVLVALAAVLAAVVAAGVLVDRRAALDPQAGEVLAASLAPLAASPTAGGSTTFCAGGTGAAGPAPHVVHLANPGDEAVDVSLTVVPGAARGEPVTASPRSVDVDVPPGATVDVPLAEILDAPYLSAVVEAGPGALAVEHSVGSEGDSSLAPCASTSSSAWHVAAGVTTRDAHEELLLFNPFPDGAVVDISLTTPEGQRVPNAFAGLIVPARQTVAVDVGAVVSRHPVVSASVTARTGRLVVDRIQRFDGSDGPAGLDLTPAAPAAAQVWAFANGAAGEGESEVVTVYNPTDQAAEVDVEVALDPSPDPAQPIAAEPFQLSVAPLDFAQVEVHADGRVPAGRGHRITVRSQNGVGVVAERWIRGSAPTDGAPGPGLSATLGSPVQANSWVGTVAAAGASGGVVTVANPGGEAVRAAVTSPDPAAAAALRAVGDLEIPASGRVVVDLAALADLELDGGAGVVVVVQATGPVVVERLQRFEAGHSRSLLLAGAPTVSVLPAELPVSAGPLPTVTSTTSTTTTSTTSTTTTSTTVPATTTTSTTVPATTAPATTAPPG